MGATPWGWSIQRGDRGPSFEAERRWVFVPRQLFELLVLALAVGFLARLYALFFYLGPPQYALLGVPAAVLQLHLAWRFVQRALGTSRVHAGPGQLTAREGLGPRPKTVHLPAPEVRRVELRQGTRLDVQLASGETRTLLTELRSREEAEWLARNIHRALGLPGEWHG